MDKRGYLYRLINEHLLATNLLKDYNGIMICNKTGDNIGTIINKQYMKQV